MKITKNVFVLLGTVVLLFNSCLTWKIPSNKKDGRVFISVDGNYIEMVVDEYDNPYLKEKIMFWTIYIPFTFPTEDNEIPRVYETKSKNYGTPSK